MSLFEFFPMKKRRLCKTPNGPTRRSASTLGKLKNSSDSPSASKNGIEILWDNNSPSPTTTIALAGKRRRRQNVTRSEETALTDVSFVVQKLSENTSPRMDEGHSTLLEMWTNKTDEKKNSPLCEDEFTSPPFRQTRYKKTTSPLSTPLIQRRTSKRQSRKATRQFMLEIRKLVDDIQKSDLSSSSQSQKEIQCKITEDRAQVKRAKNDESSSIKVKPVTQSLSNGHQPCSKKLAITPGTTISGPNTTIPEPNKAISDCLLEDSFDWTEDDMDELILTCQLSSSGKGSLTVPDPPKPQCGLSPSQVVFVPETQLTQMPSHATCAETQCMQPQLQGTQMLFNEELNTNEVVTVLNTNQAAKQCEHAQEVPEQKDLDKWELNFDEDDSLLASAAQEFELSQEGMAKPKCSPIKQSNCQNNGGFSLLEPLLEELLENSPPTTRNSNNMDTSGCFARKENQNHKNSNGSFKEPLKTRLPTTRNSSHVAKNYNQTECFSKKLDEFPRKASSSKTNDPKHVLGQTAKFGGQRFNKVPTTNSNSLQARGNCTKPTNSTKGTVDVSTGSMATPEERTKLTLRRTTPSWNKAATSFENPTRANENHHPRSNVRTQLRGNEGSSSPLQSIPGNSSYREKLPRLQTNLEKSKGSWSKQTTTKNYGSVVKECKPNCNDNNVKKESASTGRKSSLLQKNEVDKSQNNKEDDFFLCEDNFAALLDDFNFDDVLTEAITQPPTNTTTTNNFTKTCTSKSAPAITTVNPKKYSKDEIERKRLEAQRRRLAKAKQKNATQLSNTRISKR